MWFTSSSGQECHESWVDLLSSGVASFWKGVRKYRAPPVYETAFGVSDNAQSKKVQKSNNPKDPKNPKFEEKFIVEIIQKSRGTVLSHHQPKFVRRVVISCFLCCTARYSLSTESCSLYFFQLPVYTSRQRTTMNSTISQFRKGGGTNETSDQRPVVLLSSVYQLLNNHDVIKERLKKK